jgi:hypothetical protein
MLHFVISAGLLPSGYLRFGISVNLMNVPGCNFICGSFDSAPFSDIGSNGDIFARFSIASLRLFVSLLSDTNSETLTIFPFSG